MRIAIIIASLFLILACDSGGDNKSNSSNTTTNPPQPRILSVPPTSATVGAAYVYLPTVTGSPSPTLAMSGFPAWLAWDGARLSGRPTQADIGTSPQITLSATNSAGVDTQTFSIAVVPNSSSGKASQILSTPPTNASVGELYEYSVVTSGTPTPSVNASGLPAWLSLSGSRLSGTPADSDLGTTGTITITASNGVQPAATQNFQITVVRAPSGPKLSLSGPGTLVEGTGGVAFADFEITLTPGQGPVPVVSVDFATSDVSATAQSDYVPNNGTLYFQPGETSHTVQVRVISDNIDEPLESFAFTLTSATNTTILVSAATVEITDDDPDAYLTISGLNAFNEPQTGTRDIELSIQMNRESGKTVSFDYTTIDETAVSPDDFTAISGTIVFAPGELSKTLTLTIAADTVTETPHEHFSVEYTNPQFATLSTTSSSITIRDFGTPQYWVWGDNSYGHLGCDTVNSSLPLTLGNQILADAVDIDIGEMASVALMPNGRVLAWGSNASGLLGDPLAGAERIAPDYVPGLRTLWSSSALHTGRWRSSPMEPFGAGDGTAS